MLPIRTFLSPPPSPIAIREALIVARLSTTSMQARYINILVLPSELLVAIFSFAPSLQDLLNLGFTCSILRDTLKTYGSADLQLPCPPMRSLCVPWAPIFGDSKTVLAGAIWSTARRLQTNGPQFQGNREGHCTIRARNSSTREMYAPCF